MEQTKLSPYDQVMCDVYIMPVNSITSYPSKQYKLTDSELLKIQGKALQDDIGVIFTRIADTLLMKIIS